MSSPDERRDIGIDIGLLRQLAGADVNNLPKIFVHKNSVWITKGGGIAAARIDSHNNLHLAEADFVILKTMLPVKEIGRVREDVTEFAFDILPHHLLGGLRDQAPVIGVDARKQVTRGALGHDPLGRRKKIPIRGVLH